MSAPHPAIALIHAGQHTEAVAYMTALDDERLKFPMVMLMEGFPDYAVTLLEALPPRAETGEPA